MSLGKKLKQRTDGSLKPVLIENIDQQEVSDNNQGVTGGNSLKGFTLLFAKTKHLFAVFKEGFNGLSASIVSSV